MVPWSERRINTGSHPSSHARSRFSTRGDFHGQPDCYPGAAASSDRMVSAISITATTWPHPAKEEGGQREVDRGRVIAILVLAAIGSAGGSGNPDATPAPTTATVVTPAPTDNVTPEPSATDTPWTQADIDMLTSTFTSSGDCASLRSMYADASAKAPTLDLSALKSAVAACDATPTVAPTPKPTPALTASQRNAIAKAQDYLAYTSFSRSGLIDQLVFEGFSKADSTYRGGLAQGELERAGVPESAGLPLVHLVLALRPH